MVHIVPVRACWDQSSSEARLFVIRAHTVRSARLGPKWCLNTQGFCGRSGFQDERRLWLLLNDPIKKKKKITLLNLLQMQVGVRVTVVEKSFNPSTHQRMQKSTHTSEPEKESTAH